jgi:ketosteroid isomerase-like protein
VAHPNEVLLREANAALGRGDMDALRQYWAEDIRWHMPGRSPLAGYCEGAAQIAEFLGRVSELSGGTYRSETHDVLADDEHIVVLSTSRAERGGKHWEDNIVRVSRIRDGRVTEIRSYIADQYAFDEFWS